MTEDEAQGRLRRLTPDQLGAFGEDIWKNVLAESGWLYIPLARIADGGAPMARRNGEAIILPDYQACKDGKTVFVEAKAKTQSIIYNNAKQERHGIDLKNYVHYIRAAAASSLPCAIGIVELWREESYRGRLYWSGSLLIETLRELGDPRSENPETPPKVYWRRKQFRDVESFTAVQLYQLAYGKLKRSFKFELDRLFDPYVQRGLFNAT
jgi:hypothetical protein